MGLKAKIASIFAKRQAKKIKKWADNAVEGQDRTLKMLVSKASKTEFGKDHNFKAIKNYNDFKKNVPVQDYEGLKSSVEKVVEGMPDVLWPGLPLYFCKTSGWPSFT